MRKKIHKIVKYIFDFLIHTHIYHINIRRPTSLCTRENWTNSQFTLSFMHAVEYYNDETKRKELAEMLNGKTFDNREKPKKLYIISPQKENQKICYLENVIRELNLFCERAWELARRWIKKKKKISSSHYIEELQLVILYGKCKKRNCFSNDVNENETTRFARLYSLHSETLNSSVWDNRSTPIYIIPYTMLSWQCIQCSRDGKYSNIVLLQMFASTGFNLLQNIPWYNSFCLYEQLWNKLLLKQTTIYISIFIIN